MFDLPWDDCPVSDQPDRHDVLVHRLKPGLEAFYRLLGPWRWTNLHHGPRSSLPCIGEAKGCPFAPCSSLRWEGYAPGLFWDPLVMNPKTNRTVGGWKTVIVPISKPLRNHLLQAAHVLTGLVFRLRRIPGRKCMHEWEVMEEGHPLAKQTLPAAFDVRPILFRMWNLSMHAQKTILLSDDSASVERPPQASEGEAQPG